MGENEDMMPTDSLTCEVTPDSIEPTMLSCSMPPLEWLDLWTMFGAWATVGSTLLLAYFAWKAWSTSRAALQAMEEQLAAMKRQEETSYGAALAQMKTTTDLAAEDRRDRAAMATRGALANHLTAWSGVRAAILNPDLDLPASVQSAEASGIVWRMLHADSKAQLAGGLEWSKLIAKAAILESDRSGWHDSSTERRRAIITDLDHMIELFQLWETDGNNRPDTSTKIATENFRFKNGNETLIKRRESLERLEAAKAQMKANIEAANRRYEAEFGTKGKSHNDD